MIILSEKGKTMADYIKREDAINMVRNTFAGMTTDTLELRINDIPSADVVQVIRCKDCKYSRNDELWHMRWCKGLTVKDEHFCADGERKNNEID